MSSYAQILLHRYARRGVLLDTNLLLLYVIGRFDLDLIKQGRFKRLTVYTADDFFLLLNLMQLFTVNATTPHVLSEVSNWIGNLPSAEERACLTFLSNLVPSFTEITENSAVLTRQAIFPFVGLTDAALALAAESYLIVTDDLRFIAHLNQAGLEALNINHLRGEKWLMS